MAYRTVIEIDENLCDGCGLCAQGCPEGALKIIEGKARLVGESLCDGLGACIGECPRGAIRKIEREARPYDERQVIEGLLPKGMATILAHLEHLRHHGQDSWYQQALSILEEKGIELPPMAHHEFSRPGSCPSMIFRPQKQGAETSPEGGDDSAETASFLENWPIQLHLINPRAPYFQRAHLLVAASCTAFACGNFHPALLTGKKLVIGCPKLDVQKELYVEKMVTLIDEGQIRSITVVIMEVPCCAGLLALVQQALSRAKRSVPLSTVVVSIEGGELSWK